MSIRLSVVMISKNSSNFLKNSLLSVTWADEIILLDSGSHDNTVSIARSFGAKVFIDKNWLGYGIQRQKAQKFATGDYIFMMDTDECVTPKLRQSIQMTLLKPKPKIVYKMARRNYFLGKWMRYGGWYPDYVIRLYERKRYQYNSKTVHESLVYNHAQVMTLDGDLKHFTGSDFSNFQKKQLNYAISWAKDKYHKGNKISFILIFFRTFIVFLNTLILRLSILDGKQGWILSIVKAQYTFNKYTQLWTMYKNTRNTKNNR